MKILIRPEETGFAVKMKCFLHLHFKQDYVFLKVFEEDKDKAVGDMIITRRNSFTSDVSCQPLSHEM